MIIIILLIMSYIDIKTYLVPVSLQVLLLIVIIIDINFSYQMIIYPLLIFFIFALLNINKKNQIGGGDIKVLIILSIEYQFAIFYIIAVSTISAILFSLVNQENKVPFIPFLTIGVSTFQILS